MAEVCLIARCFEFRVHGRRGSCCTKDQATLQSFLQSPQFSLVCKRLNRKPPLRLSASMPSGLPRQSPGITNHYTQSLVKFYVEVTRSICTPNASFVALQVWTVVAARKEAGKKLPVTSTSAVAAHKTDFIGTSPMFRRVSGINEREAPDSETENPLMNIDKTN
jgi:hypothetical protein